METVREIWLSVAQEKYPHLTEEQLMAASMTAAAHWYNGDDDELSHLFDQYVMLKKLTGIEE
jgi:hypothetical protein